MTVQELRQALAGLRDDAGVFLKFHCKPEGVCPYDFFLVAAEVDRQGEVFLCLDVEDEEKEEEEDDDAI